MKRCFFAIHRCGVGTGRRGLRAFTLIELLVVIAIVGILAAVALPRLKGFGSSNASAAATRQLLDDVAMARASALASRSTVYMVFVPPEITNLMNDAQFLLPTGGYTNQERIVFTNLAASQYSAYALFSERNVGDQPGRKRPRYLTPWRTLPSGIFFPVYKYQYDTSPGSYVNGVPPFDTNVFPFPLATSPHALLPYIEFDYQGRLAHQRDETIPLALGSIFYPRDENGRLIAPFVADVLETPLNNSVNLSNHVRIDWLTGRGRVERQQLQ